MQRFNPFLDNALSGIKGKNCFSRKFQKFTGKHLRWCPFFNKVEVRPAPLFKRDSLTKIFLWFIWNFQNSFFMTEHMWIAASGCYFGWGRWRGMRTSQHFYERKNDSQCFCLFRNKKQNRCKTRNTFFQKSTCTAQK